MRFQRVLFVVLAAVALTVAVASILQTVRGFYQLDFSLSRTPKGDFRVESVPDGSSAADAALYPRDRIISIDGIPTKDLQDPLFSLAGGSEHALEIRRAGRVLGPVSFQPPPPTWDRAYLARTLVGIFALICSVIAVIRTERAEAPVFLLLSVSALLVGAIPHRTASSALVFSLIHRAAGMAMPFLLIRFFLVFPKRRLRLLWLDILTIVSVCWALATPFRPDIAAWWPVAVIMIRVLFTGGLVAGVILQIRRWWKDRPGSEKRRQIEWAGLGLFVGLLPYGALLLLPQSLGIAFEPFGWMAILPIAAIPLGFLAALEEYRLWDLEPITRDLLSATIIITTGGMVFLLTDYLLQRFAGNLGNFRNLFAFAVGVVLVIFLQPVRSRVESFLDRWLYYGRPTPQWLLTYSTRDIATAQDPEKLLASLTRSLNEGLEIEPVLSYLRSDEKYLQRLGDGESPAELPVDALDQPFPSGPEKEISALGIRERILLRRGGTIHGVLYLGGRRGFAPLGSEARAVVEAFAAQAALGLENARRLDELKKQAEEYRILHANTRRIIESSAAAILVCDARGRILSANQHAAEIFRLRSGDLMANPLDDYILLPESWKPHLPLHAENAEARTRGDPPADLIMAVSVLELETGSFNGRVVVLQDVTELRNLQDQVREQERLAALGRFAAGLAHEINTPLTGISSYAQMLGTMTAPDDRRAGIVKKLVDQSFRVARIVANLRELVRSETGDLHPVDVAAVAVEAARETARSLAAENRLKLIVADRRFYALAREGAVELAVTNLVRNAIEASPQESAVELEIRTRNGKILIEVRDHGPGIPDVMRKKAFEPFVTSKTEGGGTGLGLAITRDMISRLEGDVRLENLPAGGTRAVIELKSADENKSLSR